jgi:hypothetical protein
MPSVELVVTSDPGVIMGIRASVSGKTGPDWVPPFADPYKDQKELGPTAPETAVSCLRQTRAGDLMLGGIIPSWLTLRSHKSG